MSFLFSLNSGQLSETLTFFFSQCSSTAVRSTHDPGLPQGVTTGFHLPGSAPWLCSGSSAVCAHPCWSSPAVLAFFSPPALLLRFPTFLATIPRSLLQPTSVQSSPPDGARSPLLVFFSSSMRLARGPMRYGRFFLQACERGPPPPHGRPPGVVPVPLMLLS